MNGLAAARVAVGLEFQQLREPGSGELDVCALLSALDQLSTTQLPVCSSWMLSAGTYAMCWK
jgi:hypothetical protein